MDAEHFGGFSGRRSFSHETLRKCDLVRGQFRRSSEANAPLFGRRPVRSLSLRKRYRGPSATGRNHVQNLGTNSSPPFRGQSPLSPPLQLHEPLALDPIRRRRHARRLPSRVGLDLRRRGEEHAFPTAMVLPVGACAPESRWFDALGWRPIASETKTLLSVPADATFEESATAAYERWADMAVAGVAYHF
jgi:hypothetical protein